eukprot:TRINITY_DN23832_c0_g1_i3.p3 TRINITY_DN23832_c0_g1~~TRINITY_DN23832_c0_g1_i3.p3  ORF type:complete len:113 (+),score=9.73 TRINITY_DN23832_c0_g1_i3:492-830(+)
MLLIAMSTLLSSHRKPLALRLVMKFRVTLKVLLWMRMTHALTIVAVTLSLRATQPTFLRYIVLMLKLLKPTFIGFAVTYSIFFIGLQSSVVNIFTALFRLVNAVSLAPAFHM